jgi:hypothetical protein
MDHRLIKIKQAVEELAAKIGIEPEPIGYGKSINGLYIEAEGQHWITYHLMCMGDRGGEELIKIAVNEDELLYAIFRHLIYSTASSFAANSPRTQDWRRLYFQKKEELMGLLNADWEKRMQKEHLDILKSNSFDDNQGLRVDYSVTLRSEGIPDSEAWDLAVKKYPYPKH